MTVLNSEAGILQLSPPPAEIVRERTPAHVAEWSWTQYPGVWTMPDEGFDSNSDAGIGMA